MANNVRFLRGGCRCYIEALVRHLQNRYSVSTKYRTHWSGYLLALLIMAGALGVRLLIAPVEAGLQYITFFPAVTLSVLLSGFRIGLFATILGALLATCIFTPPYYALSWATLEKSFWSNLVFIFDGTVVSLAIDAMHRYRLLMSAKLNQALDVSSAVESNNRHLRQILEHLPINLILLDRQGNVAEVNQTTLQRIGRDRDAVIGKAFVDLSCWTYDPRIHGKIQLALQLVRQGLNQRFDVAMGVGGRMLPVDFQLEPVYAENGEITGYLAAGVDISARKQAEIILLRHKTCIDTAHDGFWITDMDGYILDVNQSYAYMSGYTEVELVGMHISAVEANEDAADIKAHLAKILAQGHDTFETRHRRKDGHVYDVEVSVNFNGETRELFAFFRDITERKQNLAKLRIAAVTFDSPDGIMVTDTTGIILQVNRAFQEITGYSAEEVIGKRPSLLGSGRHDKTFYKEMWTQLQTTGYWSGEIWDRRKNGQIYPKCLTITAVKDDRGTVSEYVATFGDITERKRVEEEIRNLAFYDDLTKLPNRRLLQDRIEHALLAAARNGQYGALLFLDMDKFKLLNDTLGHHHGDIMLVEVANRLKFSVREADSVARIGGDEFVLLLEKVGESINEASQKAALVAEKIRAALAVPYHILNHVHHSTPSIGVRLFGADDSSVEDLLKHADAAMYEAKNGGRNQVRFFDPDLQKVLESRAAMEADLRRALDAGQLQLYYQPQCDVERRVIGVEALIRWLHPERGLIPPLEFIPIAEESSLILDIGCWVLNTACRQLAEWQKQPSMRHLQVAINVSAHQFNTHDFIKSVQTAISAHGVDATALKLELTETVIVNDVEAVKAKMLVLKALGVKLSLDDFGTGYSSLAYLKQLPLDQLKIDRSFVRDIATDPSDEVMVKAIIDMANNFHLQVIAEGVETGEQLNFLKLHGCEAFQGYLFGRPVPASDLNFMVEGVTSDDRKIISYVVMANEAITGPTKWLGAECREGNLK